MQANKEFWAVRTGDVYPTKIEIGEQLSGRILEIAQQIGAVSDEKPTKAAPKNKAMRLDQPN